MRRQGSADMGWERAFGEASAGTIRVSRRCRGREPTTAAVGAQDNDTVSESELWDLTDRQGNPSGRTHRRGAPDWPAGYFHVVAATCVVRDDNLVLLTKRAATKDYPLTWEFPAGSALTGERSVEAAIRELREETGLSAVTQKMGLVGRFTEPTALIDLLSRTMLTSQRCRLTLTRSPMRNGWPLTKSRVVGTPASWLPRGGRGSLHCGRNSSNLSTAPQCEHRLSSRSYPLTGRACAGVP